MAHRHSWELERGPIPDGLDVLHRCDNRPCIRPDHLFLGTHTDNMRDMRRKGRGAKHLSEAHKAKLADATRNAWSNGKFARARKLNEDMVREIRSSTESAPSIARRLGVDSDTIRNVRKRKAWAGVE